VQQQEWGNLVLMILNLARIWPSLLLAAQPPGSHLGYTLIIPRTRLAVKYRASHKHHA